MDIYRIWPLRGLQRQALVLTVFLLTLCAKLLAQTDAVARVRYVHGAAQASNADNTTPRVDIVINMPVPAGERLSTGQDGEVEVEFPDGSVLRLTPKSEAILDSLDTSGNGGRQASISLESGLFYLELRASDLTAYTVTAADESIVPGVNAVFRVRLDKAPAEIAVLTGSVTVNRGNLFSTEVQSGESLRGDPKRSSRYLLSETIPEESWDNWNEGRSQAALDASNARTAARDSYAGDTGYGWSDLDSSGSWYSVSGEGMVWQPSGIGASFDPYANGIWVYYQNPGYVFVSGYPWGWLPYRCGNWNWWGGFGWGWVPGANCGLNGAGYGYGGDGRWNFRDGPPHFRPPVWPGRPVHPQEPVIHVGANPPKSVLPVQLTSRDSGNTAAGSKAPVKIGGVTAVPLRPVSSIYTSRGRSAVGSSLLLDFPIRPGTHEQVIGLQNRSFPGIPSTSVPAVLRETGRVINPSHLPAGIARPEPTMRRTDGFAAGPNTGNAPPGLATPGQLTVRGVPWVNGSVPPPRAVTSPIVPVRPVAPLVGLPRPVAPPSIPMRPAAPLTVQRAAPVAAPAPAPMPRAVPSTPVAVPRPR